MKKTIPLSKTSADISDKMVMLNVHCLYVNET